MNAPQLNSYAQFYPWGLMIPDFLMPPNIKQNKEFVKWTNEMRFINNLNKYTNLRVSSFEWKGLPPTIDPVVLEMIIMLYGTVGFHRTENGDYLCLGLYPYGKDGVSINGRPYNGYLYGFNGKMLDCKLYQQGISEPVIRESSVHRFVDADYDTVMGQENYTGYPFFNQILSRVIDLTNREKILNQNIQASSQPIIISCEESEKETIKRELNSIDEGQYRIITFKGAFKGDGYEVLNTGFQPQVIQVLADEIQRCKDELKAICGINVNGAQQKKERLIQDEVNSRVQEVDIEIEQALVFRKRFCEQIKEAFGLDIDCEFRYKTEEIEPYQDDNSDGGNDDIQSDQSEQTNEEA